MLSDLSSFLFDEVNMWNVDVLRLFCCKRYFKVLGNKVELVVWVFVVFEMGFLKIIGCVKVMV